MTRPRLAFFGALLFPLACSSSPQTHDAASTPQADGPSTTGGQSGAAGRDAGPIAGDAGTDAPMNTPDVSKTSDATVPDGTLAGDRSSVDAASDGPATGAVDSASDGPAPYPEFARVGQTCSSLGQFGFGDGSLLVCKSGLWRYAIRSDVPDGTPGAFTKRPAWYPPLGVVLRSPAPDVCPAGGIKLTELPIAADMVSSIIPYGALIGNHVTPIDHMYLLVSTLNLDDAARAAAAYIPVRAPADGVIYGVSSLGSPTSMRVDIAHGCETRTVFLVVNKLAGPLAAYQAQVSSGGGVNVNIPIKAGETFALQRDNPLDYSFHDGATWLSGFAHPFPYVSGDTWKPYTVDPLPYFPPAVAQMYAAKMQRTQEPRVGRIDWDKIGSAAGNWYAQGTIGYAGVASSTYENATALIPGGSGPAGKNSYSWSHLALAPHWVQPATWIASMGTWADAAGDFVQLAIKPGPVAPDQITTASGTVVYELVQWSTVDPNGQPYSGNAPVGYQLKLQTDVAGVLAVRVNADGTLTVEKRPDLKSAAAFTAFTAKAETFWR